MQNWKKWNNCTIFWWVSAFGAGWAAYAATSAATSVIVALIVGVALAILVGFGMTRVFCQGASAGVMSNDTFTAPAIGSDTPSIVNAAAVAALNRRPVTYYPPTANAFGATGSDASAKAEAPKPAKAAPKPAAKAKPAPKAAAPKAAKADKAPKAAKAEKPPKVAAPKVEPTPDYDGDGTLEGTNEGTKPAGLTAARGGKADNLKEIKGIGPKLETLCNEMGFYHFDQIAGWSADEIAWVNANLAGFKGRVTRDNWIEQAKVLAAGGETEFSKRVDDGDVY